MSKIDEKQTIADALIALLEVAEKSPEDCKSIIVQCVFTLGSCLCKNSDTGLGDRVLCIYKDGSKAFWKPFPPHVIMR